MVKVGIRLGGVAESEIKGVRHKFEHGTTIGTYNTLGGAEYMIGVLSQGIIKKTLQGGKIRGYMERDL